MLDIYTFSLITTLSPHFFARFFTNMYLITIPTFPPIPLKLTNKKLLSFLGRYESTITNTLINGLIRLNKVLPLRSDMSNIYIIVFFIFHMKQIANRHKNNITRNSYLFYFIFHFQFRARSKTPVIYMSFYFF